MRDAAYIFPGQGAQYVGMGQDFYLRFPQAKKVFAQANEILKFDLSKLCFQGPEEELIKTVNCQVAIFTASIACLSALEETHLDIACKFTAGLSLGEYTALVAAEALSFEEGLKLVKIRGEYMQQAAEENPGGMISLIGLSLETVEEICQMADVEIANLNCPGQIVISGNPTSLEKAKRIAEAKGVNKAVPLNVSGAFHSSLMNSAKNKLAKALVKTEVFAPNLPVVSNVTAGEINSSEEIKANLANQLVSRTRWEDSINFISSCGIRKFIEIGPGKALKGLIRKINPELKVYNIGTVEELERLREEYLNDFKG